jgi:hypothetical protein
VDSLEGNGVGIYLDAGFFGLNIDHGGGCDFVGGLSFLCVFFVVNLWWIDGEVMVAFVVMKKYAAGFLSSALL